MSMHTLLFSALLIVFVSGTEVEHKRQFEDTVSWVWVGGVTDTSAEFRVRVTKGLSVRLYVSSDGSEEQGFDPTSVPVGTNAYPFSVTNLKPNTYYHYGIAVDGVRFSGLNRAFHTFPKSGSQSSFTFAFSSGQESSALGDDSVFPAILDYKPLFFLHMGPLHTYQICGVCGKQSSNTECLGRCEKLTTETCSACQTYGNSSCLKSCDKEQDDLDLYRNAYNEAQTINVRTMFESVPVTYMFGDRDFGPEGSSAFSPANSAARKAYLENVPHYPLTGLDTDSKAPLYQAFTVGRVRFILTDTRSARSATPEPFSATHPQGWNASSSDAPDSAEKTMLGSQQLDWLKSELLNARASHALTVWVNNAPWIGDRDNSEHFGDGWWAFSRERIEISDFIRKNGIDKRLVQLSAGNMLAFDNGTNNRYESISKIYTGREGYGLNGWPVLMAGPLDVAVPKPTGQVPYSEGVVCTGNASIPDFEYGSCDGTPNLLSGMHVANGQFATMEIKDSGSTISFVARGHNINSKELVLEFTSPELIVSGDGYTLDSRREKGIQGWGGVLIYFGLMLAFMILGIAYYVVRGRSLKSDIIDARIVDTADQGYISI
eukprot:TRINITY_DN14378_c0_g1_i1.p1 TRINITY_DN14378_c0_g1~~TRINITY_DN14378_c0_g1_i1.p1  ORF type:complete len:602 (+),score=105.39 TRINITY_DN14378_c0_g1_i1:13-1818(+)